MDELKDALELLIKLVPKFNNRKKTNSSLQEQIDILLNTSELQNLNQIEWNKKQDSEIGILAKQVQFLHKEINRLIDEDNGYRTISLEIKKNDFFTSLINNADKVVADEEIIKNISSFFEFYNSKYKSTPEKIILFEKLEKIVYLKNTDLTVFFKYFNEYKESLNLNDIDFIFDFISNELYIDIYKTVLWLNFLQNISLTFYTEKYSKKERKNITKLLSNYKKIDYLYLEYESWISKRDYEDVEWSDRLTKLHKFNSVSLYPFVKVNKRSESISDLYINEHVSNLSPDSIVRYHFIQNIYLLALKHKDEIWTYDFKMSFDKFVVIEKDIIMWWQTVKNFLKEALS